MVAKDISVGNTVFKSLSLHFQILKLEGPSLDKQGNERPRKVKWLV